MIKYIKDEEPARGGENNCERIILKEEKEIRRDEAERDCGMRKRNDIDIKAKYVKVVVK